MITIGCGCGSALDWIEPSSRLIEEGLDYMILETIGTAATCQAAKRAHDGGVGYHPYLEDRLEVLLGPAAEHGTTIVTNAGIVDPIGAGQLARQVADDEGVSVQVISITGDDCMDLITDDPDQFDTASSDAISANAYIGAEEVIGALERLDPEYDAHVVIGGRLSDPALVVGPLVHEFGWALDDWDRLGQATVIGHLLECSAQVTGGYFCDPPRKPVEDLYRIGYPYAEVTEDGTAVVTKPEGSGGRVDRHTVREQLFYEVHDPSEYVQPDVVADFTTVELAEVGEDRVEVSGGTGRERPEDLKVLIGSIAGYQFEKFIPLGGPNAVGRAEVIIENVEKRLEHIFEVDRSRIDLRMEILGVNGLYGDAYRDGSRTGYTNRTDEHEEVILRVAGNAPEEELLDPALRTVSTTLPGPGGSGIAIPYAAGGITEKAEIEPVYLPRERVTRGIDYVELTSRRTRA
ncbi:acyclic terpene utilization AtuA family protein [Natronorarus salvus]|uniref:acyclic terpene utilization AtuA family protein n=1 Tax=Natronorarus salvus TaxID=3117733 RepID=UPI002F265877